jgi:hypothetical protein
MPFFVAEVAVGAVEAVAVVAEVAETVEVIATVAEVGGALAETAATLGEVASAVEGISAIGEAGGMLGAADAAGGLGVDALGTEVASSGIADAASTGTTAGLDASTSGIADSAGTATADASSVAPSTDVTQQAIAASPSTPTPNASAAVEQAGGDAGGMAGGGDGGSGVASGGTGNGVMAPPDSFLNSISSYLSSPSGKQMLAQGISGLGKALMGGASPEDKRAEMLQAQQDWEHNNMSTMPKVGIGINPNANVFGSGPAPVYAAPTIGQPGYVPPRPGLLQTVRK